MNEDEKSKDMIVCKKYGIVSTVDTCRYCHLGTIVRNKLTCENYDDALPSSNQNSE